MALPTSFANATSATGQQLDNNFQAVGALTTLQCAATGTNAISLTPAANAPAVTAYNLPYPVKFGFVGFTTSTGAVTLQVGSLASLPVYTPSGSQAAGGDIIAGFYYEIAYVVANTYNSGNGAFVITNPLPLAGSSPVALGETRGLLITNNGVTPNTKINITASSVLMVTTAGLPVRATAVSVTIDLTTTGANGMDTGARPTSGWVYLYLISTGLVTAGLATATSPTSGAPTMPTGYSYATYVGAMRCDGSQNLLRSRQLGNSSQYVVTPATNTSIYPAIDSGSSAGSYRSASVTAVVPLTAVKVAVAVYTTGGQVVGVAPNANYVAPQTAVGAFVGGFNGAAAAGTLWAELLLEATTIFYISNTASGGAGATGWTDYYSR